MNKRLVSSLMRSGQISLVACALATPMAASAGDVAVSGKLSTLGLGLEFTTPVAENVTGRLGFNAFSYDNSMTESDIEYDVDLKLQSVSLLADWYPATNGFRVTAGVLYNKNKFSMHAQPSAGATYTINGVAYPAANIGTLDGDVTFKKLAPYIGIGWGNPVEKAKQWGFVADLGVVYQNTPQANMVVTCGAALTAPQCTTLKNDVAAEQAQLQDAMDDYKWYPVISIGASYKF